MPHRAVAATIVQMRQQMRLDAAKAGAWNSLVEMAESWVDLTVTEGHHVIPLDFAKVAPPPSTGDALQDAILKDNYESGSTAVSTIVVATPLADLEGAAAGFGRGSAAEAGAGLSGVPARAGAANMAPIPGRLSPAQMAALQAEHGVEFAQIYRTGPGTNGGGGQYFLIRGGRAAFEVPIGPDIRWISHSHPATLGGATVPLRASTQDYGVLQLLQQAGSPQRTSLL